MKAVLNRLLVGDNLSRDEAAALLVDLTSGAHPQTQVASALAALRMKGITLEELRGFHRALRELGRSISLDGRETLDLCGTGGDGKDSFNISTTAAFVVAGAGVTVAKHGNYGLSSLCGSSTVLEHLKIPLAGDEGALRRQVERANICILHAPLFQPALKALAPLRRELGFRTIFNLLGPLLNPARPRYQLIGVADRAVLRLYSYFLQEQGTGFTLVSSADGYDEASLTAPCHVRTERGEYELDPADVGLPRYAPEAIAGGTSIESHAKILVDVLKGEGTRAQRDVVVMNAALAIAGASAENLLESMERARESLDSGRALRSFEALRGE